MPDTLAVRRAPRCRTIPPHTALNPRSDYPPARHRSRAQTVPHHRRPETHAAAPHDLARATLTGCRKPCSAPTAPVRSVVPSITQASSSISPSRLASRRDRPCARRIGLDQTNARLDRVQPMRTLRQQVEPSWAHQRAFVVGDQDHSDLRKPHRLKFRVVSRRKQDTVAHVLH